MSRVPALTSNDHRPNCSNCDAWLWARSVSYGVGESCEYLHRLPCWHAPAAKPRQGLLSFGVGALCENLHWLPRSHVPAAKSRQGLLPSRLRGSCEYRHCLPLSHSPLANAKHGPLLEDFWVCGVPSWLYLQSSPQRQWPRWKCWHGFTIAVRLLRVSNVCGELRCCAVAGERDTAAPMVLRAEPEGGLMVGARWRKLARTRCVVLQYAESAGTENDACDGGWRKRKSLVWCVPATRDGRGSLVGRCRAAL
jgi:hypothetical protein